MLSAWIMRIWGWKFTGKYPHEVKKLVLAVAPHTSNWDFPVGVFTRSALKIDAKFVAKHTVFKGILGPIMRWLRGIPVDRTKAGGGNFVNATADIFKQTDYLHLVIAPEGTRKRVERFKTGFYHIARLAGVPILLCTFDWGNKVVHFDEKLFWPTDNETADLEFLWNYYKGVKGCVPENGVL
jgi:1-acyl-sn-glycerol-3-phosphate acyltransferase